MDVDTLHAIAPRPPEGFCDQPAPVPLTRHLGDQADEAELALPWLTKVELEQADVRLLLILHGEDLDAGMVDDGLERLVVTEQPRKPQPARPDAAEERPIVFEHRRMHLAKPQAAGGHWAVRRPMHFQEGHDRDDLAVLDRLVCQARAYFHRASGGRLIRMASMLPPVLSPKSVPRSESRLNST